MSGKKVWWLVIPMMLAIGAGATYAQQITIDNAIRNAAWGLSSNIDGNARVAVLAMQADSIRMSDYLINEMTVALTGLQGVQGFTVMARSQVNQVVGGLPFSPSDSIDNAMAQSIGRVLDAQFVVIGSFESIAGFFRFRAQVIEVETANVRGIHTADVQNDGIVAYFMGPGTPRPGAGTQVPIFAGEHLRVNWISGGIAFAGGGGFTGFGLNFHYERDFNDFFSLGVSGFYNFPVDFGVLANTRLFVGGSPFYFGLGLGFGMMRYWYSYWCSSCRTWHSYWVSNIGLLVTPSLGLRLGGRARGFFGSPYVSFPMVIGGRGFTFRAQPGVAFGGSW